MEPGAQLPEALAARELPPALLLPALRVPPEPNGLRFPRQLHTAARIERAGLWQRQVEVMEEALVDPARLKSRHLGGTHIKRVRPAAEGAGATAALAVGLQQLHIQALGRQQGCGSEAGDAASHHRHITTAPHAGMLAAPQAPA